MENIQYNNSDANNNETILNNDSDIAPEKWERVHFLSIFINGIGLMVFLVFIFLANSGNNLPEFIIFLQGYFSILFFALVLLFSLSITLLIYGWDWFWTRYYLSPTHLLHQKGKFFKTTRQIPLEKIQSVETTATIVSRIFGLVKVHVESAGSSGSHLNIAYLRRKEGSRLVTKITRASKLSKEKNNSTSAKQEDFPASHNLTDFSTPTVSSEGTTITKIDNRKLVISQIISFHSLSLLFAIATLIGITTIDSIINHEIPSYGQMFFIALTLLGYLSTACKPIFTDFNTTIWKTNDSIRSSRGLTTLTKQNTPLDRIHGIQVTRSLFWRIFDWWSANIVVVGRSINSVSQGDRILPIGNLREIFNTTNLVFPILRANNVLTETFTPELQGQDWYRISSHAYWLSPLDGRTEGLKITDDFIIRQEGLFEQRFIFTPLSHVQAVEIFQGPISRKLGLAGIKVHLASNLTVNSFKMKYLPIPVANQIKEQLSQLVFDNIKYLSK